MAWTDLKTLVDTWIQNKFTASGITTEAGNKCTIAVNNAESIKIGNQSLSNWIASNRELIFPIGYIWLSTNPTSPAALFGGSWTPITGKFLYCNAGTGTGGEAAHIIKTTELPAHNHTRGDMNITGNWKLIGSGEGGIDANSSAEGAFTNLRTTGSGSDPVGASWNIAGGFTFDASKTWTGNTSTVGSSNPASISNMPPYQEVYAWKRTA